MCCCAQIHPLPPPRALLHCPFRLPTPRSNALSFLSHATISKQPPVQAAEAEAAQAAQTSQHRHRLTDALHSQDSGLLQQRSSHPEQHQFDTAKDWTPAVEETAGGGRRRHRTDTSDKMPDSKRRIQQQGGGGQHRLHPPEQLETSMSSSSQGGLIDPSFFFGGGSNDNDGVFGLPYPVVHHSSKSSKQSLTEGAHPHDDPGLRDDIILAATPQNFTPAAALSKQAPDAPLLFADHGSDTGLTSSDLAGASDQRHQNYPLQPREVETQRRAERDAICRDRNREYARNTRLRKKAYVQHLEQTVRQMKGERERVEEASVAATQLAEETRCARRRTLDTLFQYRARGEVSEAKWATILDADVFELSLPVTPYRSYDPRDVVDVAPHEDWRMSGLRQKSRHSLRAPRQGSRHAKMDDISIAFAPAASSAGGCAHLAGARRVCKGIQGMIFDTASFAVMLQSVGVRHRRGHRLLRCKFELDNDAILFDAKDQVMGLWSMRTLNAMSCGAKSECVKQGMLQACFNAVTNKITKLTLYFDVYAFMRELRVARNSPVIELVPNTLSGALRLLHADEPGYQSNKRLYSGSDQRESMKNPHVSSSSLGTNQSSAPSLASMLSGTAENSPEPTSHNSSSMLAQTTSCHRRGDKDPRNASEFSLSFQHEQEGKNVARLQTPQRLWRQHHLDDGPHACVITTARRPHNITHANRAFVELCGYSMREALGRSLRIIQGPATDASVVSDLLADVARQLPASMIVVNYRRNGERFINYLRVFPLVHRGAVTHYLGELERLDDAAIAEIENAPSPEWRIETVPTDDSLDDEDCRSSVASEISVRVPSTGRRLTSIADNAGATADRTDAQRQPNLLQRNGDVNLTGPSKIEGRCGTKIDVDGAEHDDDAVDAVFADLQPAEQTDR